MLLVQEEFGSFCIAGSTSPVKVKSYTWTNSKRLSVTVITYGATITSIKVPGKDGIVRDIVAGFDSMEGYLSDKNHSFGATIGRVTGRIANGRFKCGDGKAYVTKNDGKHCNNGGHRGFDKVLWDSQIYGSMVTMRYVSNDYEEGFPGRLSVEAHFELTEENEFIMQYKAETSKATCVNIANNSFFNLAGFWTGAKELYQHQVAVWGNRIVEFNSDGIPTGRLVAIPDSSDLNLQRIRNLESAIKSVPRRGTPKGFDHHYCVNKSKNNKWSFIGRMYHPESGRKMDVFSNQPGVYFSTVNRYEEQPKDLVPPAAKNVRYYKHGLMCLRSQNFPDAPNHHNFPPSILNVGDTYCHNLAYKFSVNR